MQFTESNSMKVSVTAEQARFLSSPEKIERACKDPNVAAFDIQKDGVIIGFVLVRKYDEGCFFLWDLAIDAKYQNHGYGSLALAEFMEFMHSEYRMHTMTTTYIFGNEHAKHLYEKLGFIETDVIDEPGCHEVNMIYHR